MGILGETTQLLTPEDAGLKTRRTLCKAVRTTARRYGIKRKVVYIALHDFVAHGMRPFNAGLCLGLAADIASNMRMYVEKDEAYRLSCAAVVLAYSQLPEILREGSE